MSIASTTQQPAGAQDATRRADGDGGMAGSEPRSWISRKLEDLTRSPKLALPGRGTPKADLVIDRVRAAPAVSPGLSLQIGVTACLLGVAGLVFPRSIVRMLGGSAPTELVRSLFGARELASGIALTNDPTRADILWARVAADAFDVAALATLNRADNPRRVAARGALAFVLLVSALDVVTAVRMTGVQRNCR